MDTWEERYLKLVAEHDKILTDLQKYKKGKEVNPDELQKCKHISNVYQKRSESLYKDIAKLYKESTALKIESFFKTMWGWAKSGFKLTKELGDKRLAICNSCPHLQNERCTLCGCFMKAKTKIPGAQCPIQKWKSVNLENDNK